MLALSCCAPPSTHPNVRSEEWTQRGNPARPRFRIAIRISPVVTFINISWAKCTGDAGHRPAACPGLNVGAMLAIALLPAIALEVAELPHQLRQPINLVQVGNTRPQNYLIRPDIRKALYSPLNRLG